MRVDMDHAERAIATEHLQDRQRDRVIAADRKRDDARTRDLGIEGLDVGMAFVETEPALHGYVADIGDLELAHRRDAQHVLIGADPLDRAHGAGAETGAGAVCHTKVHGHADKRYVETDKARRCGIGRKTGAQQRCGISERPFPSVRRGKDAGRDRGKGRILDIAALGAGVFGPQCGKLFLIHAAASEKFVVRRE